MAPAPGHLLGQIIGNLLEMSIEPLLEQVAQRNGLYLDKHGSRPVRSGNQKLTWTDLLGNAHDLDFVLERGGTDYAIGRPAAFIESAWRRYTKHSRAKAQEIQGALLPLLATYNGDKPFAGVIVAGEWTKGALEQMRSSGFTVLHLSYGDIVTAFRKFEIDVGVNEATPDDYLEGQVKKYLDLDDSKKKALAASLCADSSDDYLAFVAALEASLGRRVTRVLVLPTHGNQLEFETVSDAVEAVRGYNSSELVARAFVQFEIQMSYSNGDTLVATFKNPSDAVRFLESYRLCKLLTAMSVLSRTALHNWTLCKSINAYGIPNHRRPPNVNPGDRLFVWIGGRGFVAECRVIESLRPPRNREEAPWPGGNIQYGYIVKFEIMMEVKEAVFFPFIGERQGR